MSADKVIQLRNCRLFRDHKLIDDYLWIRNGQVINPEKVLWIRNGQVINPEKVLFDEKKQADIQMDCNNSIIAPGFIDLQINGGYGIDFSSDIINVEEGVKKVSEAFLTHGVTSFCPTIVTSPKEHYQKILPKIPKRQSDADGATILGVHLEGPFINPSKKGAHPEEFIENMKNGIETVMGICILNSKG